jgi:tyrosyl-tRNA synthetase
MSLDKETLMAKWKEISSLAVKTFQDKISQADLEKVKGNAEMMAKLVEEKLGITREEAQKKVQDFMSELNQKDLKGKAELTLNKALDTASSLLDKLNKKMNKD